MTLISDVAVMTGGGIGQLCNAIPVDEKHTDVVIYAGNNEVQRIYSPEEFIFTLEKAKEKLQKLARECNITMVLPSLPITGADVIGKQEHIKRKMNDIAEIKIVELEEIDYDVGHPSVQGTKQIVEQIQKGIGDTLVLEGATEDIATNRKYSQVQVL